MARDWRRAVLAAFAAVMLGCACAVVALAQQSEGEGEGEAKAEADSKGKKKQDPAEAQRAIESALKQLEAGRADQAIHGVSAALAGGNLPPAIMAKALLVRGVAYRKQGRPAQAISDLSSALWLKGGLGGDERDEALREKAAAYADAGLHDPGEIKPTAPKSSAGGGGGNWLSGLFGGFGSKETPSPPPAPKVSATVEPEPPPSSAPKASSWTGTTETTSPPPKAAPPKAPKTAKAPPASEALGKRLDGHYLVQLAAKRTQAEALALANRAKREHGALLAARDQSIERVVYGNMGAFYRAQFGPFDSAQETQSVCAKLQGSGIDCLPVTQ